MRNLYQSSIAFFEIDNKIVVGRWMYDSDFSIVKEVKNISFDCKKNKQLGATSEYFGKDVFEKLVKSRFENGGWKVASTSIKIKENKKIKTDIDLVAFKGGLVVLGQVKVANCSNDTYSIWKAGKTIKKGIDQAIFSERASENDPNLIYSILKKENVVTSREEIVEIISIVITSSNYFNKIDNPCKVEVVGIELLDEWLVYTQSVEFNVGIKDFLNSPFDMYKFSEALCKTESIIDTDIYKLIYEEVEVKKKLYFDRDAEG